MSKVSVRGLSALRGTCKTREDGTIFLADERGNSEGGQSQGNPQNSNFTLPGLRG